MTDTTAPTEPTIVHKLATSTVNAFVAHWDKLLNAVLGAVVAAFGIWFTGNLNKPASVPAPKVEIVRTVPSTLEAKIDALAKDISDLKAALPSRKKK